jgi:hypothetical protein
VLWAVKCSGQHLTNIRKSQKLRARILTVTSIVAAREALESQRRELIIALMRIDAQIKALKGQRSVAVPVVIEAGAEDAVDIFGEA